MNERRPLSGRAPRLHVLMVASEAAPWAKSGGLADVVGALPDTLDALGHRSTVVVPRYRGMAVPDGRLVARSVRVGATVHQVALQVVASSERRRVVFVDAPGTFDREGYYGAGGRDYADNAMRFALLSGAALEFAEHDEAGWPVDVVHAHDWQTGLVPTWLSAAPERWPRLRGAGLVFTIHNLAYQGAFPRETVPQLGLPWSVFTMNTGEFWGQFSFLKSGITHADRVTTVSPGYARETLTAEFGFGFEGVLASLGTRYAGILNGIDTTVWDPEADTLLPATFSSNDLAGKRACKRALLERCGLPVGDDALDRPLIGMVARLVEQKGIDLVLDARPALSSMDATWIFLGSGEARFEAALRAWANEHPSRVAAIVGFDEALAHLIEAGADMFLMPSRFEPCGLNQMYSLRYGTVPIVHAVGGLDDTVQPYTARARGANGFKFKEATPAALARTVRQAVRLFGNRPVWMRLIRQGMSEDHSWEISAREYVRVYRRARLDRAARDGAAGPGPRFER